MLPAAISGASTARSSIGGDFHDERHAGGREQRLPRRTAGGEDDRHDTRRFRSQLLRPLARLLVQRHDRRGGFLDRAARHVDHRPVVAGAELARRGDLVGDRRLVDVGEIGRGGVEAEDAVLAELDDALGAGDQADDQRMLGGFEFGRQRNARHDRDVGGLDAAVGEIDRGRRLRRAADADQHDVGFLDRTGELAVVVDHGEVERIDAAEVFRIENVLGADAARAGRAEVGLQHLQDRLEHGGAGNADALAGMFQALAERRGR